MHLPLHRKISVKLVDISENKDETGEQMRYYWSKGESLGYTSVALSLM